MISCAGNGDEVLIGGIVRAGVVAQIAVLVHVLDHISRASICQRDEIGKVDVCGEIAMTGHGDGFLDVEEGVSLVAAQGAEGAAMVEGFDRFSVIDGDEGSAFPEGLPCSVPLVVTFLNFDDLPFFRPVGEDGAFRQGIGAGGLPGDAAVLHGEADFQPCAVLKDELAHRKSIGQLIAENKGSPARPLEGAFDGGVNAHESPAYHGLQIAQGARTIHHEVTRAQLVEETEVSEDAGGHVAVASAYFDEGQMPPAGMAGAFPLRYNAPCRQVAHCRGGGEVSADAYVGDVGAVVAVFFVVEGDFHVVRHGNPVAVGKDVGSQIHGETIGGGVLADAPLIGRAPACA